MSDIIFEIICSVIIGGIFVYLLLTGRREEIRKQNGWVFILAGFAFLLFGMVIDITDNFPVLNKYIVIGDTEYQTFIEKVIGYLLGLLLLAIGFWKWMPTVIALRKTERALKKSHDELEARVRERTEKLVEVNDELQLEISERKKAKTAIRESEERFRTLVEQSPVSVQIMDPEGKTIIVNRAWGKLWGITMGDLDGYNILQDKQLEGLGVLTYLNKAFSGKAVFIPAKEYDAEKTLGKGEKRWVEAHAYPVIDESGDISMVVLMHEDITKRKLAEDKVQASLEEKEVLLKEIHHRVKNNMTVVSSLLRLQSAKVDDEHYREIFNDSVNRIKTMASIHEKLYQSVDLSKIIFSDYIRDTMKDIFRSYGPGSRIKLITDIEGITLGIDSSIPCGLIVNELITNSMKHAFPEEREGEIKISLHKNDKGKIELIVGDNGIGMPEGLDFRKTDSLGLTLVNALVGQLQGAIELNTENGTEYLVTFKG